MTDLMIDLMIDLAAVSVIWARGGEAASSSDLQDVIMTGVVRRSHDVMMR